MVLKYTDKLMEHFKNPQNVGCLDEADAKATEGSPACGDMVTLYLKVDPDTLVIEDISFESYGCASNIATGSIITEMAKGKTLDEAKEIDWKSASDELGGLPSVKAHCSVLAVETLREAIRTYEETHGLIPPEELIETTSEVVLSRLTHVMNPITGLDIVKMNLVTGVGVKDGEITVTVGLDADHPFAENINEEIHERLDRLWDIEKVEVIFAGDLDTGH